MNALWVMSRATGLVSLVLLTGVMVLGTVVQRQRRLGTLPQFVLVGLHRNVALLGVLFVAVHVAAVVYDPYVTIRWLDAVLPFAGSYRPFFLGLGAVAVDLALALVGTSLVRHRLRPRVWRAVHWAAYAFWPVALLHAVGTGSDMHSVLGLSVAAACTAAVLATMTWRFTARPAPDPEHRAAQLISDLRSPARRRADSRVGR